MSLFYQLLSSAFCCIVLLAPGSLFANGQGVDVPDEYQTNGALGLALQNGATAHLTGFEAIRANPAMMSLQRQYEVTGAYHWPRFDREFFQAGVVDSKTSPYSAGVALTKFSDKIDFSKPQEFPQSPIKQRVHFGLSQPVGKVAVGVGGQYLEGFRQSDAGDVEEIKGTTLAIGAAAVLTPIIRFAISGQNLTNKKIAHLAPRTYRAGASMLLGGERVVLNLDYLQRQRVSGLEIGGTEQIKAFGLKESAIEASEVANKDSRKIIGSVSAQVYDAFQILAAYGTDVDMMKNSLSGGIAVVSGNLRVIYAASRPDTASETASQSISINVALNM